ncbi:MAG TPA: division plane positioning ATPase MipZ [Acidimicrobiales bacterium]|nr:division plane positioning ATPase MipZ [Acidimicrobiales bacterium]
MSAVDPTPDRDEPGTRVAPVVSDAESNVLRHYAGVVRRRYWWILLGLAVGLVGGYVSTLFVHAKADPNRYYKATTTLIAPTTTGPTGETSSPVNVQTVAFLVSSAQVTDKVAQQLHLPTKTVTSLLTATGRSDVNAVDVTAISTDPRQAVAISTAAANALNQYVVAANQLQFNQQRDQIERQLDSLKQQQTDLESQLTEPGANKDIINAELDSVVNQYRLVYENFQTLATNGVPAAGLSVEQAATPVQINSRAYDYRLAQNQNARGQVSNTQVSVPTFDETDLSTAPPVSKKLRLAIGAAAGLVMGTATAFLVEAWDDRLRRRERVEALTGLPVIAEVPKLTREQARDHSIPAVDAPGSRAAERYRAARTAILFSLGQVAHLTGGVDGDVAPVVMVTSPNPGEGKTTTVASLAAVFGDNGMRTLVIDGDFRKPAVARYLAPSLNLLEPDEPVETRLDGVWFLAAPRDVDSPADAVTRLRKAVVTLRERFDIVLLDTPPMLTTNDASDLLASADAVVLVLRAGQTRSGPAQRVSVVLARFRAEVLGVVLNGCDDREMDNYYDYGDAYAYGEPSEPPRPPPPG